jgi:hypothetical protein
MKAARMYEYGKPAVLDLMRQEQIVGRAVMTF